MPEAGLDTQSYGAMLANAVLGTGAFVAVPLFRVNHYPIGPHPAGSYESA